MKATTSRDSSSHLDLDTLADVLAGEAGADESAHLRGCDPCTSRLAELEAAEARVVAVLSTLPPPVVPADLADRLSAALTAQAPLQPARASVTALPAVVPEAGSRRRTWLSAAAAAVLLASGVGIGWSVVGGGSDDSEDPPGAELAIGASGVDWADPAAVAAALPGVLAGSAPDGAAERSSQDSAGAAADSALPEAQDPAVSMSAVDPLERLRTPDGLADCLAGLQASPDEAPVEPLALDFATYEGAPALAVVLPDPDPAKLSVFVVGPDCAQADARLLHFVRVPAP